MDLQTSIESYKEEKNKFEKNNKRLSIEKQLLETQESIDNIRKENTRMSYEYKNLEEKISELLLDISGYDVKYRKDENQTYGIISEDREVISHHARRVADWLESMDENNHLY